MTLLLAVLLILQEPATLEDMVRLSKEGVGDDELIRKLGGRKFDLSSERIVELKKEGLSDAVLSRLVAGPREIKVENLSHKPVRIGVREGAIDVNLKEGQEVRPGETVSLVASGEYAVTATTFRIRTPATLTFRGCDIERVEILTLRIDDAEGGRTCLIQSDGKAPDPVAAPRIVRWNSPPLRRFRGPSHTVLPILSDTVLFGAGIGAIVGHQSDHRTEGALIGAGVGAILDGLISSP